MHVATGQPGEFDADADASRPSLDPLASMPGVPWKDAPPVPSAAYLSPRVRAKPRRLRKTAKFVFKFAVVIAVIGGAAYAGWRFWSSRTAESVPAALQGYVDGDGVAFTPPFESLTVRLPSEPTFGRDESQPAQRWKAHAAAGDGYAVDVISLDPAKLQGVSREPEGLDDIGLAVVAAELGAQITEVETVEVGGRSMLEASAETKTSEVSIGVVAAGKTVLAFVVTSPEGSGPVLRAAAQSLSFAPPRP